MSLLTFTRDSSVASQTLPILSLISLVSTVPEFNDKYSLHLRGKSPKKIYKAWQVWEHIKTDRDADYSEWPWPQLTCYASYEPKQQHTFNFFKMAITSVSIFTSLNTSTLFYIEANSLNFATGVVLF